MTSLYEELLQQAPRKDVEKVNRKTIKKKPIEIPMEGDRLPTVEEVKKYKHKLSIQRYSEKQRYKHKAIAEELSQKYWFTIDRNFIYQDWEGIYADYVEALERIDKEVPDKLLPISVQKDYDYILSTKKDWCRGNNRWFAVDWFQWTIPNLHSKYKMKIGWPIKVASTYSANHIYGYLLKVQDAIWEYLEWFAKQYNQSVEEYVKDNYNPEDIHLCWKQHRGLYRPITYATKWSWMDMLYKGLPNNIKNYIYDYVRLIYEDNFLRQEVNLPFTTYVMWDYIYLWSNWCMVVSLTGNGEVYSEENRKLVHQWGLYGTLPTKKYSLTERIPLFYWDNVKLVKVSSASIEEDRVRHNNWMYDLYIVPTRVGRWASFTSSTTLQEVIDKFDALTYEEATIIPYSKRTPKYPKRDPPMTYPIKKNILYYNDED